MALAAIHKVADRWFAELNASVTSGDASWVLKSSGATGLPVPSALQDVIIHCEAEKVLVTDVAVDTPSSGLDTLTVTRGYGGTTAASHAADTQVSHFYYAEHHNDLVDRLQRLERWAAARCGDQEGVIRVGATALQTTAQGTPDMTTNTAVGAAVVNGQPTALRAAATLTFVAPVSNPRIDIVEIAQDGTVSAVTGTEDASPSAPSVTSGSLKLCEVYHRVGETSIKNSDDSSNGYITDSRMYI